MLAVEIGDPVFHNLYFVSRAKKLGTIQWEGSRTKVVVDIAGEAEKRNAARPTKQRGERTKENPLKFKKMRVT